MASCAVDGGCPTDYIAVTFSLLSIILLIARSTLPCLYHKVPRPKGSSFWLPAIQILASFNLLLSVAMSVNFLKFEKRHWWESCYLWAVWIEGPLGFGLLLSCRIIQASQLYYIFVRTKNDNILSWLARLTLFTAITNAYSPFNKSPPLILHFCIYFLKNCSVVDLLKRRLPPIRSYFFLPLLLFPWIAWAAFIHMRKPLNHRCHMRTRWIIPIVCLHVLYVVVLVGFTVAIRHVKFRFHELKDLWRGIVVSTSSIGIWVVAYVLNEVHDDIHWLQVTSRFLLLTMASIFMLAFFSLSSSQPLLSQMSLSKKEVDEFRTMGQALGIPDSGIITQRELSPILDPNEPLDKLLLNKRFRQSFMEFADSCLAGESLHFYEEVHELNKIHTNDDVRRIYMARHIIEKYIVSGAIMEVNISHRTRQEILTTADLAHPDLFKHALSELLQLLKMNLAKDYWSSIYFVKLKEEADMRTIGDDLDRVTGWNFSPRLSSVCGSDDPFHQEHPSKNCTDGFHELDLR